jgi:hypothetical protein
MIPHMPRGSGHEQRGGRRGCRQGGGSHNHQHRRRRWPHPSLDLGLGRVEWGRGTEREDRGKERRTRPVAHRRGLCWRRVRRALDDGWGRWLGWPRGVVREEREREGEGRRGEGGASGWIFIATPPAGLNVVGRTPRAALGGESDAREVSISHFFSLCEHYLI